MKLQLEHPDEEIKRLRRSINDLVSVLALPATWSGGEPSEIVRTLLDMLPGMLDLDLVYVRLEELGNEAPIEMVRVAPPQSPTIGPHEMGELLHGFLGFDSQKWPLSIRKRIGEGDMTIVPFRLGLQGEIGVIAAGSRRLDFPQQTETLLLSVAANQVAIGLQGARLLHEQKRVAKALDERVSQRTSELAAANEDLRKQIIERKLAEERLREEEGELKRSEARKTAILDSALDCIVTIDQEGCITEFNPAAEHTFGYRRHEVMGKHMADVIVPPSLREQHRQGFARYLATGEARVLGRRIEMTAVRADGSEFPVELAITRIPIDGPPSFTGYLRDITERKRAEEAVQESQQLLRLVLATLPVGVLVTDRAGNIVLFNAASKRIWGKSVASGSERWAQSKGFWHDSGKQIAPENWASVRALSEGQTSLNELIDIETFDGQEKIIQNSSAPIRNAEGSIVGAVIVNEDVTERVRAEEALKKAEDNLRFVLDATPAMIHTARPDGFLDYFNQRWLDYVGLPLEGLQGWAWMAVIHPEDVEGEVNQWRACVASGELFEYEVRMRRTDGIYRWVLHRKVAVRDEHGRIVKWCGSSMDIDDRKRAEEVVKHGEERIRLIIDTIPTMAWSVRPDGVIDFLNQRWLDYTGLSLEQYIKEPTGPIHPDDIPRVIEKWRASMAAGEPSEDEIRLRRADGQYRWFLIRYAPLRDEHGSIVKWFGSSIDIEDHKRAERLLRDSHAQLRALSTRLQSVREEEATRIAREIHDDLGQRLTGLKMDLGRVERLLEKLESSPAVNALLDTIVDSTELADSIIACVQEIAANLRPAMLDKVGLSAALHYESRRFQERTGVSCEARLPEAELNLPTEVSTMLFRIFQECLTNIARHAQATKVEVELKREGGWVNLRVEDNGRGLTEAAIANPESLGLLGMKERTALLGGEIAFYGGAEGGTIVNVSVPESRSLVQAKAPA